MGHEEYRRRRERAAAALQRTGVDALLLTPGADLTYLTGFEHSHAGERLLALVLRADGASSWIAPRMNREQVLEAGAAEADLLCWNDSEGYLPSLARALGGASSLAWDDEARSGFLLDLLREAPSLRLQSSSSLLRSLRLRKEPGELDRLRQAAATVDACRRAAVELCLPGRTELEIDADLRALMLAESPTAEVAFTIVAGGPNSAFPHHETGRRRLERGDVVILDFGTREAGYHSDITVTCSAGEPRDGLVRQIYQVVLQAQQAALAAVRPGAMCGEVDRAARQVIEQAGYGERFLHRTGHGLGLQIHEPPYLVSGSDEPLQEGMVFSIEPGIYLEGRFGVRLEVITAVGAAGADPINLPSFTELPVASGAG